MKFRDGARYENLGGQVVMLRAAAAAAVTASFYSPKIWRMALNPAINKVANLEMGQVRKKKIWKKYKMCPRLGKKGKKGLDKKGIEKVTVRAPLYIVYFLPHF